MNTPFSQSFMFLLHPQVLEPFMTCMQMGEPTSFFFLLDLDFEVVTALLVHL